MKKSSPSPWSSRTAKLLMLLLGLVSSHAQAIPRYYQVEDLRPQILSAFSEWLPAWGGAEHVTISLSELNSSGDVAGSIGTNIGPNGGSNEARYFVRREEQVTDLTELVAATFAPVGGTLQGECCNVGVHDINDQGEVVGLFLRGGLNSEGGPGAGSPLRIFRYHAGIVEDIGHPLDGVQVGGVNSSGGLVAYGYGPSLHVNNAGKILVKLWGRGSTVGLEGGNPVYARTLIYAPATRVWTKLPPSFNGTQINSLDEVAGVIEDANGIHPAIWNGGTIVELPGTGATLQSGEVIAFNSSGDLVMSNGRQWLDRSGNLVRLLPDVGNDLDQNHELTDQGILRVANSLYSRTEGPVHAFAPISSDDIPWPPRADQALMDGVFPGISRINGGGQLLASSGWIATPSAPRILQQPTSVAVRLGRPWSLSLAAQGAMTYQWHFNGQPPAEGSGQSVLDWATGTTLSNSVAQPGHEGDYFVVLTNITGSVASRVVRLEIMAPPMISRHPTNTYTCPGGTAEFSVIVTGVPGPTVQWLRNDVDLEGKTGPVLRLEGVLATDAASYTARVSNSEGDRFSEPALLTVLLPPSVTQPLVGQKVQAGGSAIFDAAAEGSAPLAWQWFRGGNPLTGETRARLVLSEVAQGDAGDYSVVVNNGCGAVTNGPVHLTVLPRPPRLENVRLFAGFDVLGEVGLRYRIEARDDLGTGEWQSLGELVLTNSPHLFLDLDSANHRQRTYRARLMEP